jgi:hypothetical protein
MPARPAPGRFPQVNLLPKARPPRAVRRPLVRARFVIALVMSLVLFAAVVFGHLVPIMAGQ